MCAKPLHLQSNQILYEILDILKTYQYTLLPCFFWFCLKIHFKQLLIIPGIYTHRIHLFREPIILYGTPNPTRRNLNTSPLLLRMGWRITKTERENSYYFLKVSQAKVSIKTYSRTPYAITVNRCDSSILQGNEMKIVRDSLTGK